MTEHEPLVIVVDESRGKRLRVVDPEPEPFQHVERVLTVRQPWAAAMFVHPARAKTIENRTWPAPMFGRIAIHAGLQIDPDGIAALGEPPYLEKDRGVVLGTVEVTSCHPAGSNGCVELGCDSNPWAMWGDVYHWSLEHASEFVTPIRAKGKLGLWEPDPSLSYLIDHAEVIL